MAYWLIKTEPSQFSFADLSRDGHAVWDGVGNPVALRHLRAMQPGDQVLIYHTGAEKRVVGTARITRSAYPDPKATDPKLVVVDLEPVAELERPVTLAEIKGAGRFAGWELVRVPRLSVMPVSTEQWTAITRWR